MVSLRVSVRRILARCNYARTSDPYSRRQEIRGRRHGHAEVPGSPGLSEENTVLSEQTSGLPSHAYSSYIAPSVQPGGCPAGYDGVQQLCGIFEGM
jgi:hypothetical protein